MKAASTVLLLRDGAEGVEVLLVRRHPELRFMGGLWAFPGGRVEAEDGPGADGEALLVEDAAFRRAACRELQEECAIALTPDRLALWSRWITPSAASHRYDTCFYAALIDGAPQVVLDQRELVDHAWLTPALALQRAADGSQPVSPPTWMMLEDLRLSAALQPHAAALFAAEARRAVPAITPKLQPSGAGFDAVMPWEPLYAALPGEGGTIDASRYPQLARVAALPPRRLASAVSAGAR